LLCAAFGRPWTMGTTWVDRQLGHGGIRFCRFFLALAAMVPSYVWVHFK
jgi:hypothetical protein